MQEGRGALYSPFEEHIIFPIRDWQGRYCGFGGRIFKEYDNRSKYYNSKESDFFLKGSLLFGFDMAKQEIQTKKAAFLVEGYTDCIAMVQHGFINTVATLGTACTKQHLQQLGRYAQELYVLYDGDSSGQKAILRLTELCWQVSLDLKVINLPQQDDPASFLEKGNDLQKLAKNAKNIFVFFLETMGKDFSQTTHMQKRLATIRKFVEIIKKLDDTLKQDLLLQQASQIFDIPFGTLKQELKKTTAYPSQNQINTQTKPVEKENSDKQESLKSSSKLEKKLFSAILNDIKLLTSEHEPYVLEYLSSPLRKILKKAKEIQNKYDVHSFDALFAELDEQEKYFVSRIIIEGEGDYSQATFDSLLSQFYKKHWKKILNDIKIKLTEASNKGNKKEVQFILENLATFKKQLANKGLL